MLAGTSNAVSGQISVASTGTSLIPSGGPSLGSGVPITYYLMTNSATAVYVGLKGLTTSNGFQLSQNVPVKFTTAQQLYGIVASTSVTVQVLVVW